MGAFDVENGVKTLMDRQIALVTGGATGIGAACVRALAAEGFRVGIHYRKSAGKAQALLDEIKDGFLAQADLAVIDQIDVMVAALKEKAGHLDVLVNNDDPAEDGYRHDEPGHDRIDEADEGEDDDRD
ncbi:MAG: SDR family NAD(P)-dependent oxidoreductase, partial [Smithellaceae bacterium]|nr:SDR family NAD(P)-dependent oxidoreductase [Smithellaceae bacterium]